MHLIQAHRLELSRVSTPGSLGEALALLADHPGRARIVAGGTDLLLELQRGARDRVVHLIDITRIPGLDAITVEGNRIGLGPLVTHNQMVQSSTVVDWALPLAQACWEIGSPQLRNRATIVGNLVTASPANDTITPLRALNTELELTSVRGGRLVSLTDFHTGVRRSVLEPDEMVTRIRLRSMRPTERGVFVKLGLRRAQAISVVHLTALADLDGEMVTGATLMLGSVAPTIVEATAASQHLVGRRLDDATIREAARLAASEVSPIDDVRASAGYRAESVRVMVQRALTELTRPRLAPAWGDRPVTLSAGARNATGLHHAADHDDSTTVSTIVNGVPVDAAQAVSKTLLDWLRDVAGPASGHPLTGTKEGCAEGECGACTVYLDGVAVMACLVPATRANGTQIVTIEGLAGEDRLHPLQRAFIEQGAVQCGYCIPGFLMAGAKLLEEHPSPDDHQIRVGLSGNLCRCTGYYKIIQAVHQAAGEMAE